MPVARLLQVEYFGAWRQFDDGITGANAVHSQVEAIEKDTILLQRILSNDARNVRVGQNWSCEFCELRVTAMVADVLIDANIEFGIDISLLSAGADAANS